MTSSRQVFAFARDGALPFSGWIYYMNPTTRTPIHGVIFAALVSWCLGMLGLAGANAVTAVFALAVVGQYMAYVIPISARFAFENDYKPGPFTLGKYVSVYSIGIELAELLTTSQGVPHCHARRYLDGIHDCRLSFPHHAADIRRRDELHGRCVGRVDIALYRLVLSSQDRGSSLVQGPDTEH